MDIQKVISIVSGIVFIVAFLPYIWAILKKRTKPTKSTWIIWASLDTVILVGMCMKGAINGQIVAAVIGAWTVAILTFKYGIPGWRPVDKKCLVGAISGIVLWIIFNSPLLGIAISLAVLTLGYVPTIVSVWGNPSVEDKFAWNLFCLSSVLAVLAIPQLTFQDALQPIQFLIIDSVMVTILYIRKPSF